MKLLCFLSLLFVSEIGHAGLQARGKSYFLEHLQNRKGFEKSYKRLYTEHFKKIRKHEQANQVVCLAIKFTSLAALGEFNVFQMKSFCRELDQESKVYALFTTFRQKEKTYWTRFPEFDAYSYEEGTEQYDISN